MHVTLSLDTARSDGVNQSLIISMVGGEWRNVPHHKGSTYNKELHFWENMENFMYSSKLWEALSSINISNTRPSTMNNWSPHRAQTSAKLKQL